MVIWMRDMEKDVKNCRIIGHHHYALYVLKYLYFFLWFYECVGEKEGKELQHHWSPSLRVVRVKNYPWAVESANRNGLSVTNLHAPVCGHEFTHTYMHYKLPKYLHTQCILHISHTCATWYKRPDPSPLPIATYLEKHSKDDTIRTERMQKKTL